MPNRIIRESARTSATLYLLTHGAERMFWRLTTVADDFGRFEADPRILRANCFPLWGDRIKVLEVERWRDEMVGAGLIALYMACGKLLGHFPTWEQHQPVRWRRSTKSRFPEPTPETTVSIPVQGRTSPSEPVQARPEMFTPVSNREAVNDKREADPTPPAEPESAWPSPEALVKLYNEETPDECPAVRTLSPARRAKARQYLAQFPEREFWRRAFASVKASRFLRGLIKRSGHESFVADFDWLLTKGKDGTENIVKVADGKYLDGA